MKTKTRLVLLVATAVVVSMSSLVWNGVGPFVSQLQAAPPKLTVDNAPLSKETRLATSFAPVIKKAAPSVVYIFTSKTVKSSPMTNPFFDEPMFRRFFGERERSEQQPREFKQRGLGSGVIVTKDGYILTNNHVVEGADEVKVRLSDGKEDYQAKVIGTDPPTDTAILKIEASNLPAVTMADSDLLEIGDRVFAIGNPLGVGQTTTMGIVSAKGRGGFGIVDYENFIQTDASINPGNSGGALIDVEGRLVGIPTVIISRTGGNQGLGFAIPSNMVRGVMERILSDGKVTRGFLGVFIEGITPDLAKAFELKSNKGALVTDVDPDGPGSKAGLEAGDAIIELNGKPIKDNTDLRLKISQTAPGTRVTLKLIRKGKEKTVAVKLGELPADALASTRESPVAGRATEALTGVRLDDLDRNTRRQIELPNRIEGALVMKVDRDSPAYEAGLREGDVIIEINREEVRDAETAVKLSKKSESGQMLLRVWSRGGIRFIPIKTRSAGR